MSAPNYRRILLKLSGEALLGDEEYGIDPRIIARIASEISEVARSGVEVAVVIGGGSLAGGEGSVAGSLIGALIMTIVGNGCTKLGLANWVQEIVTGAIIILAVAVDRWRQQHHNRIG